MKHSPALADAAAASPTIGSLTHPVSNSDASMEHQPSCTKHETIRRILVGVKLIGAAIVASAMGVFLFEGIETVNDIQRFFSILAFGAFLTTLGLSVNHWLQDRVVSRLFIGLSLVSISVIAAVLGALTYSLTDAATALSLPNLVTWKLVDTTHLLIALPLGFAVIAGIAAFGFRVLARVESLWMTPTMVASSALLLIPTRLELPIVLLVALAIGGLIVVVKKAAVNPVSFRTLEGRWALAMLFVPPAIMVARTLALYQTNLVMALFAAATSFAACRYWLQHTEVKSWQNIAAALGTFIIGSVAVSLAHEIVAPYIPAVLSGNQANSFAPLWAAASLLLALDVARKMPTGFVIRLINSIVCLLVVGHVLFTAAFANPQFLSSALMLLTVIGFMCKYMAKRWYVEVTILTIVLVQISAMNIDSILNVAMSSGWWGLAAMGTATLVGGAAIERTVSQRRIEPV